MEGQEAMSKNEIQEIPFKCEKKWVGFFFSCQGGQALEQTQASAP